MRTLLIIVATILSLTAKAQFPFESSDSLRAYKHLDEYLEKEAKMEFGSNAIYTVEYYIRVLASEDEVISCLDTLISFCTGVIETYAGDGFESIREEFSSERHRNLQIRSLVVKRYYPKIYATSATITLVESDRKIKMDKIFFCKDGILCIKYD